ncbi:MAG TPA: Rieske (2Fe-2S) protein [Ornithinimicrobium sp.]|uniref:Rieske (2Fe-2S) protein n=1 Tax=Ornithinimicrobium sp. TaxID=1977084 RepID=UPI002B48ED50|nr:Rieske (2Fe-2S) protein [Ornithinimicrobium sp.]HKJ11591.1 Rieske (2Fe-2S) protein [Ornithinimicrobium sp.]
MNTSASHLSHPLARRVVLRAGSLVSLGGGVGVLAACGSDDSSDNASEEGSSQAQGSSGEDSSQESTQGSESQQDDGSSMSTDDVPVDGVTYDEATNTIYSQPGEGEFVAFDATCPHQGCSVSEFVDGELKCPCHGSRFDPATGEVLGGPATTGLQTKSVSVEGDDLVVG